MHNMIFMSYDQAWKHWKSDPRYDGALTGYNAAKEATRFALAERDRLKAEGRFMPKAQTEELRKILGRDPVKMVSNARRQARDLRYKIDVARAQMRPPKPNLSGELTLAGAAAIALRREYRDVVRSWPTDKAVQVLMDTKTDAAVLEAVFEVPAETMGLPANFRDAIEKTIVQQKFRAEFAQVAVDEEIATIVEGAAAHATDTLKGVCAFTDTSEFTGWFDQAAAQR